MVIKNEEDIRKLVESDEWMMKVLRTAEAIDLPDWWIGAGFLRNKVWDAIEGVDNGQNNDVDLVYFDPHNFDAKVHWETDWAMDERLKREFPFAQWEVRNQARMHYINGFEAYTSTADGIAHWVETATCVAVRLEDGKLKFLFCHGIDDLVNLVARPIPAFTLPELIGMFHDRVAKKEWRKKWPHLKVEIN
jgi:hypothetical protein